MGDEPLHYVKGVLVSHFGTGLIGHWAPGYEVLLGAIFAIAGPSQLAAKAAQVALSTVTVWLVYATARSQGGPRAARIAGGICALYPTFVAYTHYLFSETLFLALFMGAVYALHRTPAGRTRGELVSAGILFGLTALTRSVALYFLPLWVAWELTRRRRNVTDAVAVLALALAVILPWTVRNAFKYRAFQLVDGTVGQTAYFAFNDIPFNRDLGFDEWRGMRSKTRDACAPGKLPWVEQLPRGRQLRGLFPPIEQLPVQSESELRLTITEARQLATLDLPARQRCEVANALAFVRQHPGTVLRQMLWRFYGFWGPNSFLLRAVHSGIYPSGPLSVRWYGAIKVLTVASYGLVMAAALFALGRRRPPPIVEWSVLFAVFYTGIHMLAVAYSRYRLPIMPLATIVGALWLARPLRPEGRSRTVTVAGSLIGFVALGAYYVAVRLP